MEYDADKVDEMTLALMHLVSFTDKPLLRAWKGFDWGTLGRLHEKGYICDPKGKARSVIMTEKGYQLAEELFWKHFSLPARGAAGE